MANLKNINFDELGKRIQEQTEQAVNMVKGEGARCLKEVEDASAAMEDKRLPDQLTAKALIVFSRDFSGGDFWGSPVIGAGFWTARHTQENIGEYQDYKKAPVLEEGKRYRALFLLLPIEEK